MIQMEQIGLFSRNGVKLDCPLKSVDVTAKLDHSAARVKVTQVFGNTTTSAMEVVYKFPLPHDAYVTGFRAKFGDMEIVGEFKERREAMKAYEKAIQKGDSAVYLEGLRKDIYEISLGNIAPDEDLNVLIEYTQPLERVDDEIRWSVPTVIAPRYIPQDSSVSDSESLRLHHGTTDYRLRLQSSWSTVSGLQDVVCLTHDTESVKTDSHITVCLTGDNIKLDRDVVFLARYGGYANNGLTVAQGVEKSFGKVRFRYDGEVPVSSLNSDYVFLIDVSGSMSGPKLAQAKNAIQLALRNLESGDRFNIIAFDTTFECFAEKPVAYSQSELDKADRWVGGLRPRGGTEIMRPIQFVVNNYAPLELEERIIFLFTDGQVGNEEELIRFVKSNNQHMRLYSFGIDTAVNRLFIDGIAKAGNGLPEYVLPHERIEDKVIRQFSRVHADYLKDVVLKNADGVRVETCTPIPDRLFAGDDNEWLIEGLHLRKEHHIELEGVTKNGEQFSVRLEQDEIGDPELLSLEYAKVKIDFLENELTSRQQSRKYEKVVRDEIISLSVEYGIMSSLTALVAVHERINKLTGKRVGVIVPVEMPHEWQNKEDFLYESDMVRKSAMHFDACYEIAPMMSMNVKSFSLFDTMFDSANSVISNEASVRKDATDTLDELLRSVATKQSADGSFGSGRERRSKTAWVTIGFLLNHELSMKLYRKQVVKAIKWLVNESHFADDTDRLVVGASLVMAGLHGLVVDNEHETRITQLRSGLNQFESEILHDISIKHYDSFYKHYNIVPSTLFELTKQFFAK